MTEDPTLLLQDLQSYFSYLDHLKVEGVPPFSLVEAAPPPQRKARTAPPQRPRNQGRRGRAPQDHARPAFIKEMDQRAEREHQSENPAPAGPTWSRGSSTASDGGEAKKSEPILLHALAETTRLENGISHIVAHGEMGQFLIVESIPASHIEIRRGDPFGGPIGQMLGLILKKVLNLEPKDVCLLQVLEINEAKAKQRGRDIVRDLVEQAKCQQAVAFGRYAGEILLPSGGQKGEGTGHFGYLRSALVLLTHGLVDMGNDAKLKRPTFQDLLEFKKKATVER